MGGGIGSSDLTYSWVVIEGIGSPYLSVVVVVGGGGAWIPLLDLWGEDVGGGLASHNLNSRDDGAHNLPKPHTTMSVCIALV